MIKINLKTIIFDCYHYNSFKGWAALAILTGTENLPLFMINWAFNNLPETPTTPKKGGG